MEPGGSASEGRGFEGSPPPLPGSGRALSVLAAGLERHLWSTACYRLDPFSGNFALQHPPTHAPYSLPCPSWRAGTISRAQGGLVAQALTWL